VKQCTDRNDTQKGKGGVSSPPKGGGKESTIHMIYILNTSVDNSKRVGTALCRIYGIGKELSQQICDDLGVSTTLQVDQLTPLHIDMINQLIPQNYAIGSDLQSEIRGRKERLARISSYRGIRHTHGLPTRGQRTHCNAQTARRTRFQISKAEPKRNREAARPKGRN